MNITHVLSAQHRDTICIRSALRSWTYGELQDWVNTVCAALRDGGIRAGSVVALTFKDTFRNLVCQLAVARMGGTVLSMPSHTPPLRAQELLALCKANFLATDIGDIVQPGLKRILIDFDSCLAPSMTHVQPSDSYTESHPVAPWIIVTGSGSTGKPKLMPVTHAQQWGRMCAGPAWLPYAEQDVLASLIHVDFYTTKQRYLEALFKGASIYLLSNADGQLQDAVQSGRLSVLCSTVFHAENLLRSLEARHKVGLKKLQAIILAGSTVSMSLRQRIAEQLCSNVFVTYGTNETSICCLAGPSEVFGVPGNVGRPHDGFEVEIVDAADAPLPAGATGRVRIKSAVTIDGYLGETAATKAAFRGGWFYPGDLGKLTEDGQLIHLGRSDGLMIMNGINIYPLEIEHVLTSHPAVLEAIALPLNDPVHQDIPVCAVRLKDNHRITESSLHAYAFERLGSYSPRQVFILDAFPRSVQGKVMRTELIKLLEKRVAADTAQRTEQAKATLRAMLHPESALDVNLVLSGKINLPDLDAWLVGGMGIAENEVRAAPNAGSSEASGVQAAQILLVRVLLLARAFLQIGKLPLFDTPKILAIHANPRDVRKYRATVSFPAFSNMSPDVYRIAVKESLNVFQWMVAHPLTDAHRDTLYATLKKRVIAPLERLVPGGKSTLPVLRVAHELGIPFIHLGTGVYQLGWGSKARRMDRSTIDLDTAIGSKLAQNKVVAASLLRMAGLPAPTHGVVSKEAEALAAAGRIGYPVVVKPSDRDRGEGVTVDIRDEAALGEAFRHAHKLASNKQVIVEQQVDGVCHRLFIAEGRLLYAVKRLPMSVAGDGVRTVARLVNDEVRRQNQVPAWKRNEMRPIDAMAIDAMRAKGFAPESVPGRGVLVPLRKIESTEWGGVDEDVSARIHPDNLAVAIRAAELFGLHVAGIDIITPDIAVPWHINGAIVNEVNFAPLFGGGEISRSRIPDFFKTLIGGDGKIPVELFEGANAMERAQARHVALCSGLRCWLTSATDTLDHRGQNVIMPLRTVEERVRALLCRPDVDALVLVTPAPTA